MHEAMTATIREGTPEQKLELIASINSDPDAAPYAPLLQEAVWDEDADVSVAASKALTRINTAKTSNP